MVPGIVPDRLKPGAIEQAQRVTHDALHAAWGSKMRSGVWWLERFGKSADELYRSIAATPVVNGAPAVEAEALEILRDNPRAALVVAVAVVAGPNPERPPRPAGWIR